MTAVSVVIIGSYRRHFPAISMAADTFRQQGIEVLSPGKGQPVNPGAEFVFLDTDTTTDPQVIAHAVLAHIDQADAVYLCNPGGYVGSSATFELGYATARGRMCLAAEAPRDELLRLYVSRIATPQEACAMLST